MNMSWMRSRFGGSRIAAGLVVILGVVTVAFVLARIVSPDPVNLYVQPDADEATRQKMRVSLGLNTPIWVQYVTFLGQLVRGNLGTSFTTHQTVASDLLSRLPATVELAGTAIIGGSIIGILAGTIAAIRAGSIIDHIIRFLTVGGLALPSFWIGLMLLWLFFVQLGVAPGPVGQLPIGMQPPPHITGMYVLDGVLSGQFEVAGAAARQLFLPAFTLGIGVFAPVARTVRTSMINALRADYIRTARAMGIPQTRIWFAYALKGGLLPVITMLAGVVGFAFSGAVLVEGVFGWPGLGQYALQAIQRADFPALQGFVLYTALLYVVIYYVLDIVYLRVDPRMHA